MKILYILFLFFITIIPQTKQMNVEQQIKQIKHKYAPDKRTAIFEVNFEKNQNVTKLTGETNIPEAKSELLNELKKNEINYEDEITLLPSKELKDNLYGIINLSVANIRTRPDNPEEMATQALLGMPVKVLKEKSGWYLVQTPDNYIAWVDEDGVQIMNKEKFELWNNSEKIIYTSFFGFTIENEKTGQHISDIVKGDILKLTGEEGNYYKVAYPDGRTALVSKNDAQKLSEWLSTRSLTSENIIATGKTLLGMPYLWGGTSVKGIDCSGFVKTCYYLNGVILPRDASQQCFAGDAVDISKGFDNLKPGDLLFFGFKANNNKPERVTHVAIYMGNMEFIHSSGRVKINSLDKNQTNFSEFRLNTLLKARRIINSNDTSLIKPDKELFHY